MDFATFLTQYDLTIRRVQQSLGSDNCLLPPSIKECDPVLVKCLYKLWRLSQKKSAVPFDYWEQHFLERITNPFIDNA